jgi:hypothetical protein
MTQTERPTQRGSAMLVTLIVIAALLAGGAILVHMEIDSTRSSDVSRVGMSALYCAEAGLAAAAPIVAQQQAQWQSALAMSGSSTPDYTEPTWLATDIGSHDLDGDGVADFSVYLLDNDDEPPPATNDLTHDSDLAVYIVSRCIKYANAPQEVRELVRMSGGAGCIGAMKGGCNNGNNKDLPN